VPQAAPRLGDHIGERRDLTCPSRPFRGSTRLEHRFGNGCVSAVQEPERLPWQAPRNPRPARNASVRVRVRGRWLHGTIQHWDRRGGRWTVWIQHEDPDGSPWAVWSHYAYEPAVIRPRYDDARPDDREAPGGADRSSRRARTRGRASSRRQARPADRRSGLGRRPVRPHRPSRCSVAVPGRWRHCRCRARPGTRTTSRGPGARRRSPRGPAAPREPHRRHGPRPEWWPAGRSRHTRGPALRRRARR
jgi:hypothetical protein